MDLAVELSGHLLRLGIWSGLSLALGIALLARERRSGFGGMTLGWAAVNLAIVAISARGGPPTDPAGFRGFLGFNLLLNLGWIGIGVAMARRRENAWAAGAGRAMILQGAVLQALDLFLYVRTTP